MNENNNREHKLMARLTVKGDVQDVAYRAHVKRFARALKIKGIVRNLEDDGVEIFCECDEKTLQKFIKLIRLKRKDMDDIISPNVENIKVYKKGVKGYAKGNPPQEFKAFSIDYNVKLSSFEEESLTKTEIGSLLLVDTSKKTAIVGQNVEDMHKGMVDSFDKIDKKYHSFGIDLKEMTDCFKQLVEIYAEQQKSEKKKK